MNVRVILSISMVGLGVALLSTTVHAQAPAGPVRSVEAGPIWNQADASAKCPQVCAPPSQWNGAWRTTVPNKMSTCDCVDPLPPPPPPPPPSPKRLVEAGPIWNQGDANAKCPRICRAPETWTGVWRTTVPNKMSVCECAAPLMPPPPPPPPGLKRLVEAGPIWNNGDANRKCPRLCPPPESWTGVWRTTVPNKMSVCECTAPAPPPPPQPFVQSVEAGPIWSNDDANTKCPQVCPPPLTWNGQWRTTVPNKMSTCDCVSP